VIITLDLTPTAFQIRQLKALCEADYRGKAALSAPVGDPDGGWLFEIESPARSILAIRNLQPLAPGSEVWLWDDLVFIVETSRATPWADLWLHEGSICNCEIEVSTDATQSATITTAN